MGGFNQCTIYFGCEEMRCGNFFCTNPIPFPVGPIAFSLASWTKLFIGFPDTCRPSGKARKNIRDRHACASSIFSRTGSFPKAAPLLGLRSDLFRPSWLSEAARGAKWTGTEMILSAPPLLVSKQLAVGWHLTGASDVEKVKKLPTPLKKLKAIVKPFLAEMDLALSAATGLSWSGRCR